MCLAKKYFGEIRLDFTNIVSNSISITLFDSFESFMQIKTKLFWLEMKKRLVNSAVTMCNNVMQIDFNNNFRKMMKENGLCRGFILILVSLSLIL